MARFATSLALRQRGQEVLSQYSSTWTRRPWAITIALTFYLAAAAANAASQSRLISEEQYFNTLKYIFGPDIVIPAHFAPLPRTDGLLASGASTAGISITQMQEFQRIAAGISQRALSPAFRNFVVPCVPKHPNGADAHCARAFLGPVARLLYRRAVGQLELAHLVGASCDAANTLHNFYDGLATVLEGMLISPDTLLIWTSNHSAFLPRNGYSINNYAVANRLSFFLWNSGPDDALLDSARRGELLTSSGQAAAIDRLLASPRLDDGVRAFFEDMLRLSDASGIAKDAAIYPEFSGTAAQDAREQTLQIITDNLLDRDSDYRDLFTTREIVLSPALSLLYGVSAPPGWTTYELPADSHRLGLLMQIGFLAFNAHPGRSSPTLRGKALQELLLCQHVPPPPPNVDFSLLDNEHSALATARERLSLHRKNPVCAGCHKLTDPTGLALEVFDGAGHYRQTEHGAPIDGSGNLDGRNFRNAAGLAQAVHDDPHLTTCLVKRLYAYATEERLSNDSNQVGNLQYLNRRFALSGFRLRPLLRDIALSISSIYSLKPER